MDFSSLVDWLQNGLPEFITKHWLKVLGSIIAAIFGTVVIWWRNYREWSSRQFYGTFNISFDSIRNGHLFTTAIAEDNIEIALSNVPHAVKIIQNAAKKTTQDNPFLILPEEDRHHIMSQIRACIAETNKSFSWSGTQEKPRCREVGCFFALTYERFRGMKTGKIRVIVVPEWVFDKLESPNLLTEYVHHKGRIETLKKIRDDVFSGDPQFTRMIRIYTA